MGRLLFYCRPKKVVLEWMDKKVPPLKNLAKSTVFFLASIFVLGGIAAIASVSNCGAPCDFAAKQAADLSDALKKEREAQKLVEVSQTQVQ